MKAVGLTGGIGSGKSTVARMFEGLGYLVYYADDGAKAVMDEDETLKEKLKAAFGEEIFAEGGALDRPALSKIVFQDKAKLGILNGLVHPAVAEHFKRWMSSIPSGYSKKFILKEAAILFEAGSSKSSDAVLMVYAPKQIRMERVVSRDGSSRDAVLARMDNQWPDAKKCFLADFTIFNDGSHALDRQVDAAIDYLEGKWR